MEKDKSTQDEFAELCKRAEEVMEERPPDGQVLSTEETLRLIYELQVRQVEVERQNQELRRAQEELEAARDGYSDLYDSAPIGYFTIGQDGLILAANLAGAALLGVERRSMIAKPLSDFIAREDEDVCHLHRREALETKGSQRCELRMVKKDGRQFWAEMESIVVRDGRGHFRQYRTVISDITERKQAEQALRESEEHFRVAFEASHDLLSVADESGKTIWANLAWRKTLGLTPEALGDPVERIHPEDRERFLEAWEAMEGDESAFTNVEYRYRTASDNYIFLETTVRRLPVAGKPTLFVAAHDITGRKVAEEEVRRLAKFPEEDPSPVLRIGQDGSIRYANAAGEPLWKLFESPGGERLSSHWQEQIREVFRSGAISTIEVECENRTFSLICVSVAGADYVNLYGRDVTEQRQLEEQLRQAAKLESVGRLAAGVAHEFSNLLTGIMGYAELELDEAEEGTLIRQDLTRIRDLAGRAADLTRQLLVFSRRQPMAPRVFNLNSVVENASRLLERVIGEGVELRLGLAPDLGNVRADPSQIEQVLMNLAVNAREAMPDGGTLTIETANVPLDQEYAARHVGVKPGPYVLLAVSDTGAGIDKATLQRIFEPFFTTKELGWGTGLGLATVYGIVKQHGGNIWPYSEVGIGTTFKVYLPRVEAEVEALVWPAPVEEPAGGEETVLLVEDDPALRELAGLVLEKKGYAVLTASSSDEAEEAFRRHGGKIDLLLADVVLPECKGWELYERVVANHPSLAVLYMSGYTDTAILSRDFLKLGAPFLRKPFTPADLARQVREVLDAAGTARGREK